MLNRLSQIHILIALGTFAAVPYLMLLAGVSSHDGDATQLDPAGYRIEGVAGDASAVCAPNRTCDYRWDEHSVTITAPEG